MSTFSNEGLGEEVGGFDEFSGGEFDGCRSTLGVLRGEAVVMSDNPTVKYRGEAAAVLADGELLDANSD